MSRGARVSQERDRAAVAGHFIARVAAQDLGDLLTLMRAYCDFYEASPTDEDLLGLANALMDDPEREGLQLIARDLDGRAAGFATVFWSWSTIDACRVGVMNDLFVAASARRQGFRRAADRSMSRRVRSPGCTQADVADGARQPRCAIGRRAGRGCSGALGRLLARVLARRRRRLVTMVVAVISAILVSLAGSGPAAAKRVVIGHSVRGRPIVAWTFGPDSARRKVLVVGCIHGNECAGLAIVSALRHARCPPACSCGSSRS